MQLREWQHSFQNTVLGAIDIEILPLREQGLSRELSFGIYANAYRERLHEALRDNFPALHQLLGDRDFAEMAYAFTAAHPPRAASIRWFGAELPNYLSVTEPFCNLPILSELAQFEWALRHTVDAADATRIDATFLQSLKEEQWEALHCDLHPSLTILHFAWNAPQVWRALDANQAPPSPVPLDNYWFVYRGSDLVSEWRSAAADEATAIQSWVRHESFGALCESLAEKTGDADIAISTAASFMRTWVEQGLLIESPQGENNVCHR